MVLKYYQKSPTCVKVNQKNKMRQNMNLKTQPLRVTVHAQGCLKYPLTQGGPGLFYPVSFKSKPFYR